MTTFAHDVAELQRERAQLFRRLEGSNLDVIFGQAAHTGPGAFWPANNAYGGAEVRDGAMVALLPSEADAARLAVPGGEPADQLHVTLMYLGKAADIPPEGQTAIEQALRSAVEDVIRPDFDLPLTGDGFSISVFNPDRPDKQPCIVLGLSGGDLEAIRAIVEDTVGEVEAQPSGFTIPQQHEPWQPHLTLIYTNNASKVEDFVDRVGPVTFDRLRVAFGGKVCDIPLRVGAPTVVKSLPGMDALPVGSLVERMRFSARRLNNLLLGKYNPNQPRDDEGQLTGGVPGVGDGAISSAKLKGAGRIDLEPGERLVTSDRMKGENGRAWLAVVEKDGKRSLRVGLGNATFGTRHDHGGPWRAGPDRTAEIDAERAELRAEIEDLESEIEDLEDDPNADPADIEQRRTQLEDLYGSESGTEGLPGGYTAMLDENGARQLRQTLAEALDDGKKLQAELDKPYQELDRLTLERDKLKRQAMGRKFTDEEDAEWDRLTAEIARAEAELDPTSGPERPESGYWTLAEGSIPGQWADIHYDIYLDDPDVGVEVNLGAVPHGSDMDFDDLRGAEMTASFDFTEARSLARLLAKMETRAPQVVQNRAPWLRNEMLPDGRVVKRDRKGRFAEKNAAAVLGELDDLMAKLKGLSKHMSEDEKSDLDDALDNLKLVRRSRQATADAGGPDYLEIESQQYSSLEIQADDDSVTIDFDGGGFMLAPEEAEELAGFIDVFAEIDLPSWEWSPGNEAKVFAERTTSNGLFKAVLWENGVVEIGDSASTPAPDDGDSNLILDLNDDPDAARAVADALEELAETAAKRAQGGGVQNRGPRIRAYNPNQPRDDEGQWTDVPGVDLPDGALKGITVLSQDEYAESYGDAADERRVDLGNGTHLTVRYFEREHAHVAIDLADGSTQVLEDMEPDAMRQLAYDLEDVLGADVEEGDEGDDEGIVADADSREHHFYVAMYSTGDVRLQPLGDNGEHDDYLDLSEDDAREFVEALRDMADGFDEEFEHGAEVIVLSGGDGK